MAKVVPDRIFSLAVHPTESKVLVAVGGKWGGLGMWDVSNEDESENHGVQLFTVRKNEVRKGKHSIALFTSYFG